MIDDPCQKSVALVTNISMKGYVDDWLARNGQVLPTLLHDIDSGRLKGRGQVWQPQLAALLAPCNDDRKIVWEAARRRLQMPVAPTMHDPRQIINPQERYRRGTLSAVALFFLEGFLGHCTSAVDECKGCGVSCKCLDLNLAEPVHDSSGWVASTMIASSAATRVDALIHSCAQVLSSALNAL